MIHAKRLLVGLLVTVLPVLLVGSLGYWIGGSDGVFVVLFTPIAIAAALAMGLMVYNAGSAVLEDGECGDGHTDGRLSAAEHK